MKHLFIVCLVLVNTAFAKDFRDVSWGASRAEVRAAETATELGEEGNQLIFESLVADKNAGIVYEFLPGDRLVRAYYVFNEEYTNENRHIDDYNQIETILERVYGTPDTDDTEWIDDLYQDDPSSYGLAVSIGHLIYRSIYSSETTIIYHVLTGNNYDVSHVVRYDSVELGGEADQQDQQFEDDAF